MSDLAKELAFEWVNMNNQNLSDWHQTIWNFAESAWREYRSASWYVELLQAEGFTVEKGSAGMPTAFVAEWSNGAGPVIASYAEYDAVPGNCQQASPVRAPRPGLSRFAAGHTDPHSALGIGALGGVLAAKRAMEETGIKGRLKFFGEPAEKVRGSKPIHAAAGYYDGVDAFLSFHPCYMLPLCNTTRWETHCGAAYAKIFTFECDQAHAWLNGDDARPIPAAHAGARAPGATEAMFRMFSMVKHARESMLGTSGHWSLNEAILSAGQATADNLAPHIAQIQYIWRAPTLDMADQIDRVLDRCAKAAAQSAFCSLRSDWVSKSRPGLANHVLAEATFRNLELAGPPTFDEAAINFAQAIQTELGMEPDSDPFLPACSELMAPQEAEQILREELPSWQTHHTSDDYTEMCWHAPTVRLYVGRPMLKEKEGGPYPDWVLNALGGYRATIDPMIFSAAKTIAGTIIDLIRDTDLLGQAWQEFEQRTGGGIGGDAWLKPLCDYDPPIDFRWPEYISTDRGDEWWIPQDSIDRELCANAEKTD